MFQRFFERPNSFTLGVCNGCQMISQLKDIIPGAEHWPEFHRNSFRAIRISLCQCRGSKFSKPFLKGYARIDPACPCPRGGAC